jgi:enamine deaminase RidA (YjgF/YER057c/UK114 family)
MEVAQSAVTKALDTLIAARAASVERGWRSGAAAGIGEWPRINSSLLPSCSTAVQTAASAVHPPFARYAHACVVPAGLRLIFTSGQVGIAPDGTIPTDAEAQTALAFANVQAVLNAAGAGLEHIVRVNAYVVGREHLQPYMRARDAAIGSLPPTASTLMVVSGFARPEFLVEVEVTAAAPAIDAPLSPPPPPPLSPPPPTSSPPSEPRAHAAPSTPLGDQNRQVIDRLDELADSLSVLTARAADADASSTPPAAASAPAAPRAAAPASDGAPAHETQDAGTQAVASEDAGTQAGGAQPETAGGGGTPTAAAVPSTHAPRRPEEAWCSASAGSSAGLAAAPPARRGELSPPAQRWTPRGDAARAHDATRRSSSPQRRQHRVPSLYRSPGGDTMLRYV